MMHNCRLKIFGNWRKSSLGRDFSDHPYMLESLFKADTNRNVHVRGDVGKAKEGKVLDIKNLPEYQPRLGRE